MADIASGDVSYNFKQENAQWLGRKGKSYRGTISFGDGALTYPANGIPLLKAKMGCPNHVQSFKVIESNVSGYVYEYDVSAVKLRLLEVPVGIVNTDVKLAEADNEAIAATVLEVEVQGW